MKKAIIIISLLFFLTPGCNDSVSRFSEYRESYLKMGYTTGFLEGYLKAQREVMQQFRGHPPISGDSVQSMANQEFDKFLKFMNQYKIK